MTPSGTTIRVPAPSRPDADVEEMVRRLREWPADPDARMELCAVGAEMLYRYFCSRAVDPTDAEDLSQDVIAGMLTTCSTTGLELTHGASSFYKYVYRAAERRLARHRAQNRRLPRPVEPGDFDTRHGHRDISYAHRDISYAQRDALLTWIRDATRAIPDDLELLLLAEVGASTAQLAGKMNWTKEHVSHRLQRARLKVAARLVARHVAETRWPHPDRPRDHGVCAGLREDLTWRQGGQVWEWDPDDPYGFTEQVYRRILRHAGGSKPRCVPCAEALADAHEGALRRRWLALPLLLIPPGLIERVRIMAARHGADGPLSWAPPPPGPRGPVALGVSIVAIGVVIWALMGDPPSAGDRIPDSAPPMAPARPGVSASATPSEGSPAGEPAVPFTAPARRPGIRPTATVVTPGSKPVLTPVSSAPLSEAPPASPGSPPTSEPPTPDASSDPVDGPPTTVTSSPPTSEPPRAGPSSPPALEAAVSVAAGVCAPAYKCDSTPGVAPAHFQGDCSGGAVVNFRATVSVNTGPATVTLRWTVDGAVLRDEAVEFTGDGAQSRDVSRAVVVKQGSGSHSAGVVVRQPVAAGPATAEATLVCDPG